MIESLLQSTQENLKEYVDAVFELDEGAREIMRRTKKPWDEDSRERLADAIYTGYQAFRSKHDEAYTYISEYVSVPNDLMHFLFRALDLSLVSSTHRDSVALYPSRHLMWESVSSKRSGDSPTVVAAILVPYSETTTPMRWPLLVHELAHHLSPDGDDSDRKREEAWDGEDTTDQARLDDGLKEMQADSIAEDATGITYAIALARESSLLLRELHLGRGGPTVKQRLEYLSHGQEVADALPEEWHLDSSGEELRPAEEQTGAAATSAPKAEATPPLTDAQLETIKKLADKLRSGRERSAPSTMTERALALKAQGDPIPAVPRHLAHTQADFEALASLNHPVEADEEAKIRDLFLSLADVPLEDFEILEAAWTEELEKSTEDVLEELLAPTTGLEFNEEMTRLDSQDVLLSRSLQAAAVHRWLIEHDEVISALVSEPEPKKPLPEAHTGSKPLQESSPLSDLQLARRLTLPPAHERRLVVRPLIDPGQVGGTTIDLRLGTEWETLQTSRFRSLDPSDDSSVVTDLLNDSVEEFRLTAGESQGLVLHPGELLLALTLEYLRLPKDLWGQLEGRSTWARVGLQVHATAGMVDAGFEGFLTLELQNTGRLPIVLYPGLRVGQMAFFPVDNIARPYFTKSGSAYANQAKVRTAFTRQHEHKARHKFIEKEREAELKRKAANDQRNAAQQADDAH